MKTILMMGCALALLFAAVPQPVMAANSQMNLTVGTTNDAKAGDTVTVRLVGSNNPGLSTFAARLAYDDSDLEYVGTTWANTISSDSGNIELVSPVTENNQQALNLSAILNKTYSQNETIATVTFKAKNAYTTMPVTLTVREVTDASYTIRLRLQRLWMLLQDRHRASHSPRALPRVSRTVRMTQSIQMI